MLDYGSGNLRSAEKALVKAASTLKSPPTITVTADPDRVAKADRLVLPGVGAFAACMANLSARDIDDLAAYYAYLPKARSAPTTYDESLPALVRVGDPLRNIAPCISCHGQVDQKLGTPWLEGMPKSYLVAQLAAFKSGARRNDALAQMRNMVRAMTPEEIDQVATFYARKALPDQQ